MTPPGWKLSALLGALLIALAGCGGAGPESGRPDASLYFSGGSRTASALSSTASVSPGPTSTSRTAVATSGAGGSESGGALTDDAATVTAPAAVESTAPVEPITPVEPAPEPVQPIVMPQLTVYSTGSNIRQGPTTESAIVGSAGRGEELLVFDTGTGWYQLVDGRGYVAASVTSESPPAAEPVEPVPANPEPADPDPTDPDPAAQPPPQPQPQPAGNCPSDPASCTYSQGGDFGVIAAINAERTAAGLAALAAVDSSGSQSCALASARVASLNHCGYEALWGGSFTPDAGSVVAAWMASPAHRAMLLNPAKTTVAVGWATRSDGFTVVAATLG